MLEAPLRAWGFVVSMVRTLDRRVLVSIVAVKGIGFGLLSPWFNKAAKYALTEARLDAKERSITMQIASLPWAFRPLIEFATVSLGTRRSMVATMICAIGALGVLGGQAPSWLLEGDTSNPRTIAILFVTVEIALCSHDVVANGLVSKAIRTSSNHAHDIASAVYFVRIGCQVGGLAIVGVALQRYPVARSFWPGLAFLGLMILVVVHATFGDDEEPEFLTAKKKKQSFANLLPPDPPSSTLSTKTSPLVANPVDKNNRAPRALSVDENTLSTTTTASEPEHHVFPHQRLRAGSSLSFHHASSGANTTSTKSSFSNNTSDEKSDQNIMDNIALAPDYEQQYKFVAASCFIGTMSVVISIAPLFGVDRPLLLWSTSVLAAFLGSFGLGQTFGREIASVNGYRMLDHMARPDLRAVTFLFYTDPKTFYRDGPHLDPFFYSAIMGVVARAAAFGGVVVYRSYLRDWSFRSVFRLVAILSCVAHVGALPVYLRLFKSSRLLDMGFILLEEAIRVVVKHLTDIPSTVLQSRCCRKGNDSAVLALCGSARFLSEPVQTYSAILLLSYFQVNPSSQKTDGDHLRHLWKVKLLAAAVGLVPAIFFLDAMIPPGGAHPTPPTEVVPDKKLSTTSLAVSSVSDDDDDDLPRKKQVPSRTLSSSTDSDKKVLTMDDDDETDDETKGNWLLDRHRPSFNATSTRNRHRTHFPPHPHSDLEKHLLLRTANSNKKSPLKNNNKLLETSSPPLGDSLLPV